MTTSAIGPGTLLGGRYRLDVLLSEAGPARFWRGTDTVLGRSVAVNVVASGDPLSGPLLAAARSSANVNDPHVLRVLDCVREESITWVVNEWGEGTSLDTMLQRGPLPARRAAWLAREVAETLVTAHDAGIAHGRITPESVLVTEAGAVKLIGFAVTAAIEGLACEEPDFRERGYADLGPIDTDVIDLAGILYAALTGRWPGAAHSVVPRAPEDARGPLRPRQVRAGVPRVLDVICGRVLRQQVHDNAQPVRTAHEVLAALTDFGTGGVGGEPLDVESMYVEPTLALRRGRRKPPAVPSHDETRIVPLPSQHEPPPVEPSRPSYPEPDRPLFADHERRRPGAAHDDDTGSGSAAAPGTDEWLFGEQPVRRTPARATRPVPPPLSASPAAITSSWSTEDHPEHPQRRFSLTAAGVVLLVAAMVGAFLVGFRHTDSPTPSASSSTGSTRHHSGTSAPTDGRMVRPAAVRDFDPQGQPPSENPQMAPLAVDGRPGTGWQTMNYTSAAFGNLKSGVGLLADLGSDRAVSGVHLLFGAHPVGFSVYAAPAGSTTAPTSLAGMRRVGTMTANGSTATLHLDRPINTRWVVVWLTRLPQAGGGYMGQIDELRVLT